MDVAKIQKASGSALHVCVFASARCVPRATTTAALGAECGTVRCAARQWH